MGETLKFRNQLGLLLWKNFTLRKRQPVRIVVEILLPLVLFLILAIVRLDRSNLQEYIHECHFDGKAMPSAGTIPFLQSYLCTANNKCHKEPTNSELPGFIQNFNTSVVSQFVYELEEFLSNRSEVNAVVNLLQDLNTLTHLTDHANNGTLNCTIRISDLVVDPQELTNQIRSQNISLDDTAIQELLNSTLNATEVWRIYNDMIPLLSDPVAYQARILELANSLSLLATGAALDWLANNDLTAETMNDFVQNTGYSEAVILATLEIQESVCADRVHEYLIIFEDPSLSNQVLDELCNLTLTEWEELINDIYIDSANGLLLLEQLDQCSQNHGRDINFDEGSYNTNLRLLEDLLELESLYDVMTQLTATSQEGAEVALELQDPNQQMRALNMLVCGREEGILSEVEENLDLQSTIEEQAGENDEEGSGSNRYEYDNTTTKFCNDLFRQLKRTISGRIFWRQLKPMIRGKIPYTPDTPAVRNILKEANATFEYLGTMKQLARDWLAIVPNVTDFLENDPRVVLLRTLLPTADQYIVTLQGQLDDSGELPASAQGILDFVQEQLGYEQELPDAIFLRDALDVVRNITTWLGDGGEGDNWRTTLNDTTEILAIVEAYLECVELDKFEPFKDEEKLVKKGLDYIENNKLWAALVFDLDPDAMTVELPSHIEYKIRMSVDMVDTTAGYRVTDRYWTPGPRASPLPDMKYIVYGFSYIQDMVEHAMIRLKTNLSEEIGISVQQFPYPCYIHDVFAMAISRSMPMFMVLAWIYSVAMIVKGIVYEKEQRLKEVMKMMGLGNSVHWTAWFITSFVIMFIIILLLVIILKTGKILIHSDPSVIIAFLTVFTVSTIVFCFMISVFFSRANLAAVCAGVFYFASYLPYTFCARWEEYMTVGQKAATSLFNTVAFGWGCNYFSLFEEQGVGIQWYNINESPMPDDNYSMLGCILMLMLDTVIYALITWYVEAVFPGEFGMPKPWYFLFTKNYWLSRPIGSDSYYDANANIELSQEHPDKYEAEPSHMKVGVSVRQLKKVYKRGKKVAVNGLSVNFYEDQITSFLGHNGAGKTTTLSILTGMLPPTEGTALVYGKDVRSNINEIRKNLGMCPQHNVLFHHLTVEEHIWFYARLKGMSKKDVPKEIEAMTKDTGLQAKKNFKAQHLSGGQKRKLSVAIADLFLYLLKGGQKRKLSVAIAFVAGSKVVILDEPTAGVDPYARRGIWELLLKYKQGRTIILSTHFMDEADILGDRIAIISHGQLCCSGTSLFLKSKLGNGYYLTLVEKGRDESANGSAANVADVQLEMESKKKSAYDDDTDSVMAAKEDDTEASSEASTFDDSVLTAFIRKHVPEAILKENYGSEMTYQLPDDTQTLSCFEVMFDDLDANLAHLGISSYGISDTTLEEVFLKVAAEQGVDEEVPYEAQREAIERVTEGGRLARPVTRMSFRNMKTFFGLRKGKNKERRELMNNVDAYSDAARAPRSSRFRYPEQLRLLNGFGQPNEAAGSIPDFSDFDDDPLGSVGQGAEIEAGGLDIQGCDGAGSSRVEGKMLHVRHFYAIMLKRLHHLRRSKGSFAAQILLPAMFICLAQLFATIVPSTPVEPPMEVHPWHLTPFRMDDPHLYAFYSNDDRHLDWTQRVEELLQEKPELGNRCMDPDVHKIEKYGCLKELESAKTRWTKQDGDGNDFKKCDCSDGYQVCPKNAGGPEPSRRMMHTTDFLYNMTGREIAPWLVKSHDEYIKKRYGGLSLGERNDLILLNMTEVEDTMDRLLRAANGNEDHDVEVDIPPFIQDVEQLIENYATKQNAKIWFNNKGYVSMVAYMNIMNNLILRAHLPEGSDLREHGITLVNHPMNRTRYQLATYTLQSSWVDVLIAIAVIFAMSSIPASFVLFLISERVSGAKHLHLVSGVHPVTYWLTNFCWDMLNYILASIICIIIFVAFQVDAYVAPANLPCLISLLFLYGWAIIPLMYPASFIFNVPSTAFVAVKCFNLFIGFITTIATFIVEMLALGGDEELYDVNKILTKVFLVFPQYCLGRGLIDMTRNQIIADAFKLFGEDYFENPFKWDIVGRNMFALFMQGIIFFALTLAIQFGFWRHRWPCFKSKYDEAHNRRNQNEDDEDVARERQRVLSGDASQDVLTIENLSKVYEVRSYQHRAVDNISVGIHKGECFGLLGVNGAGKTSTFKMLTGDTNVTSGNAHLAGHSVLSEMTAVQQNLGYCPQFDALCGLLSGREHLELYARLRGVPENEVKKVAKWGVHRLGLIKYASKLAGDYSGGNKRKLSTAIALVGNPPVVFLDEPTTGMDPKARRFLWNCIVDIIRDGRSVVLTSHSMEECEALCGRIAIMVNGRFECLGSIQHLKNRFGEGYTVILRVSGENADLQPVIDFFTAKFPQSELREQHHNMLQYQISSKHFALSKIFGEIEAVKEQLNIEDYSVSQTTLDQVFINFAMLQNSDWSDRMERRQGPFKRLMSGYSRMDRNNDTRQEGLGVGYRPDSNAVTLNGYRSSNQTQLSSDA